MGPIEKSRPWVWITLIFILVLLVGIPVLKNKKKNSLSCAFEVPTSSAVIGEQPLYREEVVDPEETYPMAHVASMAELPDGTLAATWYAGSKEISPDVKIYFATQHPGDVKWSSPAVIMTREAASHDLQRYIKGLGNALLFAAADGTLQLLYVTISFGRWSGSNLNLTASKDGGKTWEKSKRLFLSPFFNLSELVKNAPVPLVGGGWVIPIYQEFLGKFPELLWLRPDQKGSWNATKSRIAGGCSFFQPSLTALHEKSALAFCRDYYVSEKIWSTHTEDGGMTWSSPKTTSLPNHDSGVASVRLSNGWLLLAFNDSTTARDILCLALSKDEGQSWKRISTIVEEPQGDFCYPYFFRSHDGLVHLLYSWQRRHIHHVIFNEAWVTTVESQNNLS